MRDIAVHHLPTSPRISIVRCDGSLHFANAGYFETRVLSVVAGDRELEDLIIDGQGINQLDATGEEVCIIWPSGSVLDSDRARRSLGGVDMRRAESKRL
jgi:MFS superfamily sulfate permease-like transporter